MPRLSINASYKSAIDNLNVINRYLIKSKGLQSDMQGFVAEILMLRLFGILETCMLEVSIRIACGVPYRNGGHGTAYQGIRVNKQPSVVGTACGCRQSYFYSWQGSVRIVEGIFPWM